MSLAGVACPSTAVPPTRRLAATVNGGSAVARACLLASFGLVAFAFALAPTSVAASSVPACGHANVNNPGHHYGLIKNGCLPGLPVKPSPSPAPAPKPPAAPVANPIPNIPSGAKSTIPGQARSTAVEPSPTSALQPAGALSPVAAPAGDRNLWVVTGLLPIMLGLWLLLVAGASAKALRRHRPAAPVAS